MKPAPEETSNQDKSLNPINVFKSSLAPQGMGVTTEVTKIGDVDNGSNCSDEQALLDRKRDKKKKKKKDREERHKKRNYLQQSLFGGMGALDEMAPFDYANSFYPLGLTNQKNSGSKIYPGFYDHIYSKRKDPFSSQ